MILRDYLHANHLKTVQFAKSIDCHPITLYGYLNRRSRIGKFLAAAIEKQTKGQVTAKEIIDNNPKLHAKKKITCD